MPKNSHSDYALYLSKQSKRVRKKTKIKVNKKPKSKGKSQSKMFDMSKESVVKKYNKKNYIPDTDDRNISKNEKLNANSNTIDKSISKSKKLRLTSCTKGKKKKTKDNCNKCGYNTYVYIQYNTTHGKVNLCDSCYRETLAEYNLTIQDDALNHAIRVGGMSGK